MSCDLEIHLTLDPLSPHHKTDVDAWAARYGHKLARIELDRGAARFQPMVTMRLDGTLHDASLAARQAQRELSALDVRVLRVKIEASPFHPEVPDLAAEPGRYFEHHTKILLPDSADETPLRALAARHDAHLSRNARRRRPDGLTERFLTQRSRADLGRATTQFAALLDALATGGFTCLGSEIEYVLFDDNVALDSDWMDGK